MARGGSDHTKDLNDESNVVIDSGWTRSNVEISTVTHKWTIANFKDLDENTSVDIRVSHRAILAHSLAHSM